jgi:hypothetical protein
MKSLSGWNRFHPQLPSSTNWILLLLLQKQEENDELLDAVIAGQIKRLGALALPDRGAKSNK